MAQRYLVSFCNTEDCLRFAVLHARGIERVIELGASATSIPANGVTGVCFVEDKIYVALQSRQSSVILQLNRDFELLSEIKLDGVSDVHGLVSVDRELLIVSTGTNEVVAFEPADSKRMRLVWADAGSSSDRDHLNDLHIAPNGQFLMSCFGRRTPEMMRSGSLVDVKSGRVLLTGLREPHSPFCWKEQVYILESATGDLIRIGSGSIPERVLGIVGYARGLFIDDEFVVIGKSGYRNRSRSRLGDDRAMPIAPAVAGDVLACSGVHFIPHDRREPSWVDTTPYGREIYQVIALPYSKCAGG